MDFKIRSVTRKDISIIANIKVNSGYKIYDLEPTSVNIQKQKISKRMKDGNKYFIGEFKGKPIAVVTIKNPKKKFYIKNKFILFKEIKPSGEFLGLYILKKYHNNKFGQILTKYILCLFKEFGYSYVSCIAWEKNFKSLNMLYSIGFKFIGVEPNHFNNGDYAKIFTIKLI